MRLGIFGGTFDPVHYGHLILAEYCRVECKLDQVWFLPAAVPPHKQDRELTANDQRLQMLQLALGGHEKMKVSLLELERGGVSYTLDTLEAIHRQQSDVELFFLLGADSLHELPTWRDPDRICQLANLVVVHRPDVPAPDFSVLDGIAGQDQQDRFQGFAVAMPSIQLSSTEIRRRVAAGLSIRYQTPRAVEKYIETQRLYTNLVVGE